MNPISDAIDKMLEENKIDVKELYILLTPTERSILKILVDKKRPMTVNDIRNAMIDDFRALVNYYGYGSPKDKLEITPGTKVVCDCGYSNPPKLKYWEGEYEKNPEKFKQIYYETRNISQMSEKRKHIARLLKKYGLAEIPAFATIEKILHEFVAMGLVLSREEIVGRGKKLYVINPRIIDKLSEIINSNY